MKKVQNACQWFLAVCLAFCAVNILCFLYERPTGWFNTPNGPSPTGWRPNSVIIHGTEGYGVTKVDSNGYLNPEGQLMDGYVLMLGSSHTQGKEVPSNQKYSVLVNDHFAKSSDFLYTYNVSSDGNFLPSLIKHFSAAVEAFPEAGTVTLEIANTDFSVSELENALQQVQYDPQSSIVHQVERLSFKGKLKNSIKEYFPLLSLMKKKLETKLAAQSDSISTKRDSADYKVLLEETMKLIRSQFDGNIIFVYHPNVVFDENGEASIAYSETWLLFRNTCRAHGISVIDMGPVFLNHYEHARQLPYGFSNTTPGTGHLNKVGHQLIAQTLIEFLEETA